MKSNQNPRFQTNFDIICLQLLGSFRGQILVSPNAFATYVLKIPIHRLIMIRLDFNWSSLVASQPPYPLHMPQLLPTFLRAKKFRHWATLSDHESLHSTCCDVLFRRKTSSGLAKEPLHGERSEFQTLYIVLKSLRQQYAGI